MIHPRAGDTGLFACLTLLALTGCAEYRAENPALMAYPGIKEQIQQLYDDKANLR